MLVFLKILVLLSIQVVSIQCLIPRLTVRKVDRNTIQRKRQDTMDMCRLFNQERQKSQNLLNPKQVSKRSKRSVDDNSIVPEGNPFLKTDDIQRVEKIVDELYDDLHQKDGKKIAYRKRPYTDVTKPALTIPPATTTTSTNNETEKSGRRFDFAPKLDVQLDASPASARDEEPLVKMPWRKVWEHGIIPYFIDPKTYDSHLAKTIIEAFDYFEKVTCIRLQRLREKPVDQKSLQSVEWVYITNPTGIRQCVHSNEKRPNKGVQIVVFGYDCMSLGEIVHEVMHILGFSHEHTRPDRDQYVSIAWENIKPGYRKYFELRSEDYLSHLPYDFGSVLHYPQRAFSKNGKITINAGTKSAKLGQRDGLSDTDAEKISLIFGVDCLERNKEYLVNTCPTVIQSQSIKQKNVSEDAIRQYFENRIWPYGVVNYKVLDNMEFSIEERENIKSVLHHIEQETCIEFRDMNEDKSKDVQEEKKEVDDDSIEDEDKQRDDALNFPDVSDNFTQSVNASEFESRVDISEVTQSLPSSTGRRFGTKHKHLKPPLSPLRRHATSSLILTRSSKPGCQCPEPGNPPGDKPLEINADCFNSVNDLLHLFVHVLGLDHQHNAHDRDSYLHIVWNKLSPEVKEDMQKKLPPQATLGLPYDYQSVMHFPWLEIKDGVTNIMYPVWNDGWSMGHWQGLSHLDVQKINNIYLEQCTKRKAYIQSNS